MQQIKQHHNDSNPLLPAMLDHTAKAMLVYFIAMRISRNYFATNQGECNLYRNRQLAQISGYCHCNCQMPSRSR